MDAPQPHGRRDLARPILLTLDRFLFRYFDGAGLSHAQAARLCERGDLPGVKIGSRWYVDAPAFEAQVRRERGEPVEPAGAGAGPPLDPKVASILRKLCD